MIAIDAGPLIAVIDRDDAYHQRCRQALGELDSMLVTTWPILAEAFHILGTFKAQNALWEMIARRSVIVDPLEEPHPQRMRTLMAKYADLPMDLGDASLVSVCEQRGISHVFTIDRRDFNLYRPRHAARFTLIP